MSAPGEPERPPRGRLGLLLVFAALTVWWTWPLAAHPGRIYLVPTAAPDPAARADLGLASWIVSWQAHALATRPLGMFAANVFHPLPHALALLDDMLGAALLLLPLEIVHPDAVLNHNVLLLVSFVLGGAATGWLVQELGGSWAAAAMAGALFAFGPLRAAQLGHLGMLATQWMPLALLALHRALRTGSARAGAAFAACGFLAATSARSHVYAVGLTVALVLVGHAALRLPAAPGARRRAVVWAVVASLAVVPLLLPFADAGQRFGLARDPGAVRLDPLTVLGPATIALAVLGSIGGAPAGEGGRRLSALYLVVVVGLAAASLAVHGTAGTAVAALGAAVLAGFGTDVLRRATPPRLRPAVALLLGALLALDCWPAHVHAIDAPWADPPPIYAWLAQQPGDGAIVELPFGQPERDALYMVMSTRHWKRLVNGYGIAAPAAPYLAARLAEPVALPTLRLLGDLDVRWIVVHTELLPPERRTTCTQLAAAAGQYLVQRRRDARACAFEVVAAPPQAAPSADQAVPAAELRLTTSDGTDARAAADGDVRTHWVQPVAQDDAGWLALELPRARRLTRLVLRLGPHLGEYLRVYQVETSTDGANWTALGPVTLAEAPLAGLARRPDDLAVEIRFAAVETRHLRLVRPAPSAALPANVWASWPAWGVHELDVYAEPASRPELR